MERLIQGGRCLLDMFAQPLAQESSWFSASTCMKTSETKVDFASVVVRGGLSRSTREVTFAYGKTVFEWTRRFWTIRATM